MTMQAPPTSATAVGAELQPAQRIGDLDVFFTERGLRIARDPAPWGRVLKYGLAFGAVTGVWGIVASVPSPSSASWPASSASRS
jgi:hypothetical protein